MHYIYCIFISRILSIDIHDLLSQSGPFQYGGRVDALHHRLLLLSTGKHFLLLIVPLAWQSLEQGVGTKSRRQFISHFLIRIGSFGKRKSCFPMVVELEQFGAEHPPIVFAKLAQRYFLYPTRIHTNPAFLR